MKVAVINPYSDAGSRHKYRLMFETVADVTNLSKPCVADLKGFDTIVVYGDNSVAYRLPKKAGIPYLLVEHDIKSARDGKPSTREQEMVENAGAILVPSEGMAEYLQEHYVCPPMEVVHLRPFAAELEFEPRPKLPGKNIVYAGGLAEWEKKNTKYGYRCYHYIFSQLIRCGWSVHIYPGWGVFKDRTQEFANRGCIIHNPVPQEKLYEELSQYQAGFQGYAPFGNQDYIQMCRPNKTWEYLAAGIPTFGHNTGPTGEIYRDKWGLIAEDTADFPEVLESLLGWSISPEVRLEQVIDNDGDKFLKLLEIAAGPKVSP